MKSWSSFFGKKSGSSGEYWLTVSDLMAALMVIFLFITIAFMQRVLKVVVAWEDTQEQIFEELVNRFESSMDDWNAEFDKERLTIRFKDPDTLFEVGRANLNPRFKVVLNDFCPKYFEILDNYVGEIDEIRIEGHTSPEWTQDVIGQQAYFLNMKLSQARTRVVLEYCFTMPESDQYSWLPAITRAVGMSSAHLAYDDKGNLDYDASRRVEFRIKTKAEERIASILGAWK